MRYAIEQKIEQNSFNGQLLLAYSVVHITQISCRKALVQGKSANQKEI